MSIGPKQAATRDLECYALFSRRFTKKMELGQGADGEVVSYIDSYTNTEVAVKTPRMGKSSQRTAHAQYAIKKEIALLKCLGKHDNILGMLASCIDFQPIAPAIFFQVADLGDLRGYCQGLMNQQKTLGLLQRMPEITILKLMHDIILALDFLHEGSRCWVHTDIKPCNILVVTPPEYTAGDIPELPTFKLGDLGRMSEYPNTSNYVSDIYQWPGTFEFAPLISERLGPITPAADIWALGATVQSFALGITPVMSKGRLITALMQAGESYPHINDYDAWAEDRWRAHREVVYRPLNIPLLELIKKFDIDTGSASFPAIQTHLPYSEGLNQVYEMMLEPGREARVSAAHLRKYAVPFLAKQILVEQELDLAEECFYNQEFLLPVEPEDESTATICLPEREGFVQFPVYNGAVYGAVY